MVKKVAKRKSSKKKAHNEETKKTSHPEDKKLERVLVENFVILQKVMTDLSLKLDKLTTNISDLLEIFEKSAETLAKKDFRMEQKTEETEKILEGIKNLSEQNKIIAKGLTLVHEHEKLKYEPSINQYEPPQMNQMERPPFPNPQKTGESNIRRSSLDLDEYQSSISSKLKQLKPLPKE